MSSHGFTTPAQPSRNSTPVANGVDTELLLKLMQRQTDITSLLSELVNNLSSHVMYRGNEDWSVSEPYEAEFNRIEKLNDEVNDAIGEIMDDGKIHPVTMNKLNLKLF